MASYHLSGSMVNGDAAKVVRGITTPATVVVTGTGTVEYTISTPDTVESGSPVWVAWPQGAAAASTLGDSLISPITALRFTCTGATFDWMIAMSPPFGRAH